MPGEFYLRIKVIVYVTSFRVNESNFANFSQPETKNIMMKYKTQIHSTENENYNLKQKIVHYDRKLRFANEISSSLWVIWSFMKYKGFRSETAVFAPHTRYLQPKSKFSFGESDICAFIIIACHAYTRHFILPYNIRNRITCLKGLEIYMQPVYSWHKNGMFFSETSDFFI